jgi:hypothetical protein
LNRKWIEDMNMAILAGGLAALVALFTGVFAKVDPVLCLERATLAFILGWVCGQVWHLLIGAVSPASSKLGRVEHEAAHSEHSSSVGDTN